MFSNVYGEAGVERAIQIMKREVAIDAANAGIGNLKAVSKTALDLRDESKAWGASW